MTVTPSPAPSPSAFDQATYQVRMEWGPAGLARLAPCDVVVVVDVLLFTSTVTSRVAAGDRVDVSEARPWSSNGAPTVLAAAALPHRPTVFAGSLRNLSAVATAILDEQQRRGVRMSVGVIAAGEVTPEAGLRFAVEDQLGAGGIIDALVAAGVDHCSPEAVSAAESFRALRRAVKHLLTSSGSGRELAQAGMADEVSSAARIDDLKVVPVLRDERFCAQDR